MDKERPALQKVREALAILEKWQKPTDRTLSNGTKLICRVPHIASEAWFHELYVGLERHVLEDYESKFPFRYPEPFRGFLEIHNGLNAFSDSLRVFGYRFSYDRVGDKAIQPYDLMSANSPRPPHVPDSWLFFGGYRWDGSRVFFDMADKSERIYRVKKGETNILNGWESFEMWFSSEVMRLSTLYDQNGVKYDSHQPTVPPLD